MSTLAAGIAGNAALASLRFLTTFGCALATSVLLARALGPEAFGTYRLALSLVWALEVLASLAFATATVKFTAEAEGAGLPGAAGTVVRFFLRRATALYVAALGPFLLLTPAMARFYRDPALVPLLALGALAVLPGLWAGIVTAGLRGQQRFRELGLLALAHALATLGGTALVLGLGGGLVALFALHIALNLLHLGLAWAWSRRGAPAVAAPAAWPVSLWPRMRRYAWSMGLIALIEAVVWERSGVFFLGRFSSPEEVGFYSLAFTLALHARRLLPTAVGEVLFPVIARLEGLRDAWGMANATVHATRYLAMIGFPLAAGGIVLARPLVRALFGEAWAPAGPVLALLLASAGIVALSHPAAAVIWSKERHRFLLTSAAALAVAKTALDLLLIPWQGALGAAVAGGVVQAAAAVVQLSFACRLVGARLPIGNLVRCLAATGIALAPAAALLSRPLWGGPGDLVAAGLAFLVVYPLALAAVGVLVPEDLVRARAIEARLPASLRPLASRLLRAVVAVDGYRVKARA